VRPVEAVLAKDGIDLLLFGLGHVDNFLPLTRLLDLVVLGFSFGGKPGAQTHADGAGEELSCAADDDDVGGAGAGEVSGHLVGVVSGLRCETSSQGEGHGEAVCEANDGVS
jgi:hypothetical protein